MIQIATFLVPEQQEAANEFLRTHKPGEGGINFNKDTIVIFYENEDVSPEYEIADLNELLKGNKGAKLQQEVAMHVMQTQLADLQSERRNLNTKHNRGRADEVDNLVVQIKGEILKVGQAIAFQDIKADYVRGRIAALKSTDL